MSRHAHSQRKPSLSSRTECEREQVPDSEEHPLPFSPTSLGGRARPGRPEVTTALQPRLTSSSPSAIACHRGGHRRGALD
jgi:hypothetical protein